MTDYLFDEGKNKIEGLNKTEINQALNSKASTQELNSAVEGLTTEINKKANKQYVDSEISRVEQTIEDLPEPMIFKGSLGTGGTIEELPTASASNEGFLYKVITAGTYAGQTAHVGDVFISNGLEWVLIPAGDDFNDTWRAIKVNGTEVLNNLISSGAVNFVEGNNINITFDDNENNIEVEADTIDDTQDTQNKSWSGKKSYNEIVNILPTGIASGLIADFNTELSEPIISLMNDINYVGNVVNNIKLANVGGSSENAHFFKGLVIGTKTFIDLSTLNWSYGNNNGHWAKYYFFANLSDRALINTVLSNDYEQTEFATNSPDAPDKSIFMPTNNTYIYICDSDITSISDFVSEMNGHYLIYDPATNTQGISQSNFKAVCDSFEIANDYKIIDISGYSVYGGMLALTPSEAILTSTTNADGTTKEIPEVHNMTGITDFVTFIGQNNIFADSGDIIECRFKTKNIVSAVLSQSDFLTNKKWAVCGDSFTAGATNTKIKNGKYAGENFAYPFLIGNRVGIEILRFFASGRTLAYPSDGTFHNCLTDSAQKYYYQNIPEDVDYITIYLGINDSHHENGGGGDGEDPTGIIPIGTINDNTINTYYGAWNVVLTWLMTYRPFAHIGIIVSNGCDRVEYRTAQLEIAKKFGIPFIDMNGDSRTPVMIRSMNPDISTDVKTIILNKQAVDIDGSKTGTINLHPNDDAHLYESYFIENFLRTI